MYICLPIGARLYGARGRARAPSIFCLCGSFGPIPRQTHEKLRSRIIKSSQINRLIRNWLFHAFCVPECVSCSTIKTNKLTADGALPHAPLWAVKMRAKPRTEGMVLLRRPQAPSLSLNIAWTRRSQSSRIEAKDAFKSTEESCHQAALR